MVLGWDRPSSATSVGWIGSAGLPGGLGLSLCARLGLGDPLTNFRLFYMKLHGKALVNGFLQNDAEEEDGGCRGLLGCPGAGMTRDITG